MSGVTRRFSGVEQGLAQAESFIELAAKQLGEAIDTVGNYNRSSFFFLFKFLLSL